MGMVFGSILSRKFWVFVIYSFGDEGACFLS